MRAPDKAFLDKLKGHKDGITISQTVIFFERMGITFTKTMIQNYLRIGLLPPPLNNRLYTKKHLMFLYMTDNLKNIFSLPEIKKAFAHVINSFDTCDMSLIYNCYAQFYENALLEYKAWEEGTRDEVKKITSDNETGELLINLSMMAAASAAKQTCAVL